MSYLLSKEPIVLTFRPAAQISANATMIGVVMPFAGEIVGASVASTADHTGDTGSNKFVIAALANGNSAITLDTGTTDINAAAVAFPAANLSATKANRRFAAGEAITVTFTETGTAVNFESNARVDVFVISTYDFANEP